MSSSSAGAGGRDDDKYDGADDTMDTGAGREKVRRRDDPYVALPAQLMAILMTHGRNGVRGT